MLAYLLTWNIQKLKPDETSMKVLQNVKPQVESLMNTTYETFEAVEYTTQVVAGTNYVIKVHVGNGQHLSVKVFRPLPCNGDELEVADVTALD